MRLVDTPTTLADCRRLRCALQDARMPASRVLAGRPSTPAVDVDLRVQAFAHADQAPGSGARPRGDRHGRVGVLTPPTIPGRPSGSVGGGE